MPKQPQHGYYSAAHRARYVDYDRGSYVNYAGFYSRQGLGFAQSQYPLDDEYDEEGRRIDDEQGEEEEEDEPIAVPSRTVAGGTAAVSATKTYKYSGRALRRGNIAVRDEFTYSCPTDVQCNNGGCCSLGDYCAIRDGQLGCCPVYVVDTWSYLE